MAFKGFGRESGPSAPPKSQPVFGNFPRPPSLSPPSPVNIANVSPGSRVIRSYSDLDALEDVSFSSPPFNSVRPSMGFTHSSATLNGESYVQGGGQQNLADKGFNKQIHGRPSAVNTLYPEPRTQLLISRPQDPQQAQSPSLYADENPWRISGTDAVGGPSVSLPRSVPKKKVLRVTDFPSRPVQSSFGHGASAENGVNTDASPAVPKRTRSPPQPASQVFLGTSYTTEAEGGDEIERELEAKAKRLARFKTDLSIPMQNVSSVTAKIDRPKVDKQKVNGDYMESAENMSGDVDNEGPQAPGVIVGVCSDMCPVSEREERERKGDLDQYERINGDRNQSSKEIAVKKYTRTAERESELIRPLPILEKTMDYLLSLLDQPYGVSFLGLYNFLWDRMRAVRMDLRMQHIFNLEAISMLEQMIRLHIIAMHELCEYTKGEGFSEGFDAHLNIEQMNKTSVELFQVYDDYRKKGVHVPTEKEFRGYYALLKLDKHPGYKVEPAELSLDLAKMTPEIRQTQEVLFARDVARSCRTGNFIAFFRLGIKSSYLQACLMHAHFSKLRTQALASLHSGLQNNQGIPVAHVAKWLGLENEGIESLLEYHGFSIKEFDELYMVKDGPFLNIDKDFPTRRSELVHSKKSKHIVEDILSPQLRNIPSQVSKEVKPRKINAEKLVAVQSTPRGSFLNVAAEEVSGLHASPSPKKVMPLQHGLKRAQDHLLAQNNLANVLASSPKDRMRAEPAPHVLQGQQNKVEKEQYLEKTFQPWNFSMPKTFSETKEFHTEKIPQQIPEFPSPEVPPKNEIRSKLQQVPSVTMTRNAVHEHIASADPIIANSVHRDMVVDRIDSDECTVADDFYEEEDVAHCYDEEVAKAKIKLFLRLWRRRCARRRELREQNRLAADAALNSLSVGPPIQRKHDRQNTYERLDIDEMMNKRYKKHDESWSSFSVSDLVAGMLCEQNPHSSCICWKAALCYGSHKTSGTGLSNHGTYSSADQWLHSKLMPSSKDECSDDLVLSSPGIAIWKKWITEQSQSSCVLSVIKSIDFSKMNEDVVGSNGVVFLLSEGIELETQKLHFQNLVASIPSGSCTPLLILSASHEEDFDDQSSAVADKLGLHELDKSRICSFLIVHLHESQDTKKHDGYFSDKRLREGLEWLASKSRPQPILWSIKTRELAQSHLNSSLDAVDHMVGPNQCITAFNEALDKSVEDIVAAASANPNSWPCPELSLLHDADEYGVSKLLLPRIGWSSAEAIEPLVSALRYCKLPVFLDDMSFLKRGSMAGEELEEQRLHLQDCLISYLNQSSKMMNLTMSMKEANMMLQKNTRLELHKKHYYLVPNWVLIFRRVFNWRLNILTTRSCSKAYILEKHTPPEKGESFNLVPETWHPSYITHPSLDEMMEVIFAGQPNKPNETIEDSPMEEVRDHSAQVQSVQDVDIPLGSNMKESRDSSVLPVTEGRETDRLTQLLEQCKMVQHKIGEKLSIYF